MKTFLLVLALTAACLSTCVEAAISVGPGGSGTLTFGTLPAAGDWSTLVNGGAAADLADAAGLDGAAQTNVASAISTVLVTTATTAPAISPANVARWNSSVLAVQTVATSVGYVSLMATLQNDTGANHSVLSLSYDLTENHATGGANANAVVEEIPGHRVYFSLSGAAGSWQVIPEISSIGAAGTRVGTANLGSWANGSLLYVLWADDNAAADRNNTNNEEGGYLIDNVSFMAGTGTITGVIPVGPGGSGTITFSSYPNVLAGWYTAINTGGGADIVDATALDNAAQTNAVAGITRQLGNSGTVTPSISANALARWNYTLEAVETVSTGVGYVSLLAKLLNESRSDQSTLTIAYDLNELNAAGTTVAEEVPGHRVYYSLTGDAGSWSVIPELSSGGTPGTLIATLNLGSWPAGGLLYVLWADDNAAADRNNANTEEGGYTLDNVSFSFGTISGVYISSPTNGQTFPQGVPISINAVAVLPGTVTDVSFFNGPDLIGSDGAAPFSTVLGSAALGGHALTATATDNLGNNAASPGVNITVVPNNPPSVLISDPISGAACLVGSNILCQATASDSDGSVARVEFYEEDVLRLTDITRPYSFELCDITVGLHTVSAVAVDNAGFRGTNTISITATNPPGITVLVPNGSTWQYLDDGSDQSVFWSAPGFDDGSWSTGVAEIGYGDAVGNNRPEGTVVSFGADPNAKHPTTYFRKTFTVADPGAFSGLVLRLLRDDSGLVYLNGSEVFRSGLTNEFVDFSTYTQPGITDDGTVYQETNLNTSVLVAGLNTLAVEIHQDAGNSSDISFDLMLWGVTPQAPPLTIVLNADGSVTITWAGGGTLISSADPSVPRGSWSPVSLAASPHTIAAGSLAAQRFYTVRVP